MRPRRHAGAPRASAFQINVDPGDAQVLYIVPGTSLYARNVGSFQSGDLASGNYSICIPSSYYKCFPFEVLANGTVTGPANAAVTFGGNTISFQPSVVINVDPGDAQVGYNVPGTSLYNVGGFQSGRFVPGTSWDICIDQTCIPFEVLANGTVTGPANSSVSFSGQTILFAMTPVRVTPADPTIGYRIPSTPIYNVQGPHSAILVPGVTFSLCVSATCVPFTLAETCNLQIEVQSRVFYVLCGDGGIVANAGPDQVVPEGTLVQLDGSRSTPPLGADIRYDWTQLAGPPVTLNATDALHPTFTAPQVTQGGQTLTFQLVVTTLGGASKPDEVNISVVNNNRAPVADAGPDQRVKERSLVTLDGSQSYDPNKDPLTYQWVQTGGSSVTLSDPTVVQSSFTAPEVGPEGTTLTFVLTVSDNRGASTGDTVTIVIENQNHPSLADAGPAQTVDEGKLVQLHGSASSDPDNEPLTFSWTQLHGTPVVLAGAITPTPSFTTPLVPSHSQETLVFRLEVSDGLDTSIADVAITVLDVDAPPACGFAQAIPAVLWPPNHGLVTVALGGVSDPDNDQITLTMTAVTQDEPVQGLGEGDTSPDAVLQGDKALLRVERSGTGNGRVYRVSFTADDGHGGSCTGAVTVCVPHDRRPGTCVDDGQQYNATRP